jgi:hypothetical protein
MIIHPFCGICLLSTTIAIEVNVLVPMERTMEVLEKQQCNPWIDQ